MSQPPAGNWVNATGNLAGIASECGNLSGMFSKPDEDKLFASIAQKGLWATTDGGATWVLQGAGAGSDPITNRGTSMVFDPADKKHFWEAGIYNGNGVYVTGDDGTTLNHLGDVHHNDWLSVDLADPARKTLLAGGHEQAQTVMRSSDGGSTWTNIGAGLPAGGTCTTPLVVDSQTYLVGCYGAVSGIYRTTDSGGHWAQATASGGGAPPLQAADGSIYWMSPGGAGVTRSTDHGAHWSDVSGPGILVGANGHLTNGALIELPDGRVAGLGSQYVMISADHGATWKPASDELPQNSEDDLHGVVYSAQRRAFYVWHSRCGNPPVPVSADAVLSFAFDYEKL